MFVPLRDAGHFRVSVKVSVILVTEPCAASLSLWCMEWKATKLYSIVHFKCPYCHEGEFFTAHPYNLARTGDTHERCPVCAGKFVTEPGFYYGAMYVSYAIGVALSVSCWVAMHVLFPQAALGVQVAVILGALIVGAPFYYALSKIIWANIFFAYRPLTAGQRKG